MKESSLIIDKHPWRGFKRKERELGVARTFGFWTVTYCPFLLSAWLEGKMDLMRSVLHSSDAKARNGADAEHKHKQSEKFQPPRHVTTKSQEPK